VPEATVQDHGRVRVVMPDDPARHNCLSREMAVGLAEAITTSLVMTARMCS
jgi:hypothetical protein